MHKPVYCECCGERIEGQRQMEFDVSDFFRTKTHHPEVCIKNLLRRIEALECGLEKLEDKVD